MREENDRIQDNAGRTIQVFSGATQIYAEQLGLTGNPFEWDFVGMI